MKIAVLDYLTDTVYIREVDKDLIRDVYSNDIEKYVLEIVLTHSSMENVYVMSDVKHIDIITR